jgi:8-oxo-dGTP diphosphatase
MPILLLIPAVPYPNNLSISHSLKIGLRNLYNGCMSETIYIHKAAGILIRDRKLLVERSKGKEFFIAPGGSIEPGETPEQALVRELMEEFQITVREDSLSVFGTFKAAAAGQEDKIVEMNVFTVSEWVGEPTADNEVEEVRWITSKPEGIKIGSIFEHEVIPRLRAANLID